MSKENEKQQIVKHCVYCGTRIEESKIYCPKCGKLVIKIEPSKEKGRLQKIGAKPPQKKNRFKKMFWLWFNNNIFCLRTMPYM